MALPLEHPFQHPVSPGGNFPAIAGIPDDETGVIAPSSFVDKSELPRLRYPTWDRFYPVGAWSRIDGVTANSNSGQPSALNLIYALPFPTNGGGLIRQVAIRVSRYDGIGGAPPYGLRLGLYAPVSDAIITPGNLVWESAEISIDAVENHFIQVGKSVKPQTVYWMCALVDTTPVTANTFQLAGWSAGGTPERVLGFPGTDPFTGAAAYGITAAHTYGPYPTRFPSTMNLLDTGNILVMMIQYQS